jgi:hypothetical protein
MLVRLLDDASLAISPIIYAEVSVGFDRIEDLDDALAPGLLERLPLPWDAAFLARRCFLATGGDAESAAARCRTSILVPTQRWRG